MNRVQKLKFQIHYIRTEKFQLSLYRKKEINKRARGGGVRLGQDSPKKINKKFQFLSKTFNLVLYCKKKKRDSLFMQAAGY